MLNELWTDWLRWRGGPPCFRIYGKARPERQWRIIDVYATSRRNVGSGWPLWGGTCVTWSAEIVAVGWDGVREFYERRLLEGERFWMEVDIEHLVVDDDTILTDSLLTSAVPGWFGGG